MSQSVNLEEHDFGKFKKQNRIVWGLKCYMGSNLWYCTQNT